MNEIVKYSNYLNKLRFSNFEAMDYNILFYISAISKNKGTNLVQFTFDDIRTATNYKSSSNKRLYDDLLRMSDKLQKVRAVVKNDTRTESFILFPTYIVDQKEKILKIRVNEDFAFILNELTGEFTRFELEEFTNLSSKYSKTLYRLLKQFKNTGLYEVGLEDFRYVMDIPQSYTPRDIMNKAIKPSVDELQSHFANLVCTVKTANKRGNPVIGYKFTFTPEERIVDADSSDKADKKKTSKPKKNSFNDFHQRDYDFEELERELLEADRRALGTTERKSEDKEEDGGQMTLADYMEDMQVIDVDYKESDDKK